MIQLSSMTMFKLTVKILGKMQGLCKENSLLNNFSPFSFIVWRKANKLEARLSVKPDADLKTGDVVTGFTMQFTYNSAHTSTPEKDSQSQPQALSVRVYVNVGKISA